MANPTCYFGQRAMQRLLEIERDGPDEKQPNDVDETNQAERSFRRVRETTQPLGMVWAQTY
jgi:hypothetical protein